MRRLTLALLILIAAGCRWGSTDLERIAEDPFRYHAQSVTVKGVVVWSGPLPLVGMDAFELEEGSAKLLVLSNRPSPRTGERIKVAGTLEAAFDLGDRTAPVLLDEDPGPKGNGGASDVR